jgi:hypothetical protein
VLLVVAVICAIVAVSTFSSLFEDNTYLVDLLLTALELLGTKTTSGGGQTMAGLILVFIVIIVILISIALCNLGRSTLTSTSIEMNMNVPGVTTGEHAGLHM